MRYIPVRPQILVHQVPGAPDIPAAVGELHDRVCAAATGKGLCVPQPCGSGRWALPTFLQARRPRVRGCLGACLPLQIYMQVQPNKLKELLTREGAKTPTSSTLKHTTARSGSTASSQCPISLLSFTAQQVTHIASLCRFQAVCLPNGTGICHGPHWGPKHDSTMLHRSKLESELRTMTRRLRLPQRHPLCVYGDW